MTTNHLTSDSSVIPLRAAAEKAATGLRDREEMRKAVEEMDRVGEQVRQRQGVLNLAVSTIRELRDR